MNQTSIVWAGVLCLCVIGCSSKGTDREAALAYTRAEALLTEIELRKGLYYEKGEANPFSG